MLSAAELLTEFEKEFEKLAEGEIAEKKEEKPKKPEEKSKKKEEKAKKTGPKPKKKKLDLEEEEENFQPWQLKESPWMQMPTDIHSITYFYCSLDCFLNVKNRMVVSYSPNSALNLPSPMCMKCYNMNMAVTHAVLINK